MLERVSAHIARIGENVLLRVQAVDLAAPTVTVHLPMGLQANFSSSGHHYVANEPVGLVLSAGGQVKVIVARADIISGGFFEATVIGHFEDEF